MKQINEKETYLHPSTQAEHQVQGGLLLDIIIRKGPSILQLFPGEDKALLVRGNSFLVLDLRLDTFYSVRALHLQSYGLASEGFNKNLHDVLACSKQSTINAPSARFFYAVGGTKKRDKSRKFPEKNACLFSENPRP
jgi:hypothetical protein